MAYSLEIPQEMVRDMYFIREKSGVSIRKQILTSIKKHVEENKEYLVK